MKSGHLSTEAQQLIEAGRQGHEATELVRARVRRSVAARLAGGAVALSVVHASSLFAASKLGLALAVAGGVGAGVWYGLDLGDRPAPVAPTVHDEATAPVAVAVHDAPTAPTQAVAAASAPEANLLPAPGPAEPPERSSTAEPVTKAAPGAAARPTPRASQLTEEIALLAQASARLNQGDASGAARALAEYDSTFKHKILIQERSATGVLVECARGNVQGARSSARRFYKTWPRSPLASRIAGSCAGNIDEP